MEKRINGYGDFNTVVPKKILEDGTILCDVKGIRKVSQPIYDSDFKKVGEREVEMPIIDSNISFENGKFFTLTAEEIDEIKNPKKIENENITERN